MAELHSYHGAFNDKVPPQIELHFTKSKQAQMATALLEKAQLNDSKITITDVSFEDRGRRVNLKLAHPAQNHPKLLPSYST